MDDHTPDDSPQDRMAMAALYLESVKARMDPEDFSTLHSAVEEMTRLMAEGNEGFLEAGSAKNFAGDVQREFLVVMAIVSTGRMDHEVVDMPGPDGSAGYAVVTPEVAGDPEALAEIRDQVHTWMTERQAVDDALEGIARASGMDPED
ncbi:MULTISPECIES: hypothetical protein [Streptomyces]|uniref:Uncharacterized protein n=1 Tax=Streptomyces sanyensis TaxID=568869 RepID=A0ABP8ZMK3_9ACTN